LKNEVSGIEIPDELLEELEGKSREEAAEISVRFAAETAAKAAPYCDGFYVMTPLKRVDIVSALLAKLKEKQLI
ncbi:MAG: homocysteine methyltransferase, partial [Clostridia bacterium]|nr:homocysteine methyltransferase [Clostridia bacterium]